MRLSPMLCHFFEQENPRGAFAGWVERSQKAYKDNVEVS